MQINHSYFNQTLINFNFATAHTFHNLDKFCKAIQKKKVLANKAKDQSMMEVEGNNAEHQTVASFNKSANGSMKANQIQNAEDIQSRSQEIKQKLMKYKEGKKSEAVPLPTITHDYEAKDIEQIIFNHFANELRPKILLKYPTAPADKINKVILQKWNSLQQAKKDGYTRLTLKKIQAAKQTKKQEQQPTQRQEAIEGEQEEVLVKQQAPQPQHEQMEQKIEAKQNRFGDFLNRIKKNIKGMEEQNEKNKPFKEENQNQNDEESRIEEEQHDTNEDQPNEDIQQKQEEREQQERRQSQQQQRMEQQV